MTLQNSVTFTGVSVEEVRVGRKLRASTLDALTKDNARNYEILTGKNADGSGGAASTNTGHRHATDATRLWMPFASQTFGAPRAEQITGVETYNRPLRVDFSKATTAVNDYPICSFPIYVPLGWVDQDIMVLVNGTCTSSLKYSVKNSSLVEQTRGTLTVEGPASNIVYRGEERYISGLDMYARGTFTVASAGRYIVQILIDIEALGAAGDGATIYSVNICPDIKPANRTTSPSVIPRVGAADDSTTGPWQGIDSHFVGADESFGALAMTLARNQALTLEVGTGLPAPGNATLTVGGHDHDGDNSLGVDFTLFSVGLGCFGPGVEVSGQNAKAPYPTDNTGNTLLVFTVATPRSVNYTEDTGAFPGKLKAAVHVRNQGGKTGRAVVKIVSDADPTGGSTFTQAADGEYFMTPTSGDTTLAFIAPERPNIL